MRHDPTTAEQRLWACLRGRQLNGFKFRRQQTVGPFIADYFCSECKLIVELDGDSHVDRAEYDRDRTEWLEKAGYSVVRYSNGEVFENLVALLEDFLGICETRAGRNDGDYPSP